MCTDNQTTARVLANLIIVRYTYLLLLTYLLTYLLEWLDSRVVSVLDSGAVRPGFKS